MALVLICQVEIVEGFVETDSERKKAKDLGSVAGIVGVLQVHQVEA